MQQGFGSKRFEGLSEKLLSKKIGAQENSGQEIILNLEILLVRNCFDLTKIVGTRKLWVQNKFFGRFFNLNAKKQL